MYDAPAKARDNYMKSTRSNLMACKMTLESRKNEYISISERTVVGFNDYYSHCQKNNYIEDFFRSVNKMLKEKSIICDPLEACFQAIKTHMIISLRGGDANKYKGLLTQLKLNVRNAKNSFTTDKLMKKFTSLILDIKNSI